jgi:hypothetical protein
MALRGIRVVEFAGLAPAPFCGMLLADFGAEVIRIDKANNDTMASSLVPDVLARGKKSIAINLKKPTAIEIILKLCDTVSENCVNQSENITATHARGSMNCIHLFFFFDELEFRLMC